MVARIRCFFEIAPTSQIGGLIRTKYPVRNSVWQYRHIPARLRVCEIALFGNEDLIGNSRKWTGQGSCTKTLCFPAKELWQWDLSGEVCETKGKKLRPTPSSHEYLVGGKESRTPGYYWGVEGGRENYFYTRVPDNLLLHSSLLRANVFRKEQ